MLIHACALQYSIRGPSGQGGLLKETSFSALSSHVTFIVFYFVAAILANSYGAKTHTSIEIVAVVRGVAELPCDVTLSDPKDQVRLVLWYREDIGTPIYSVDTRDADFQGAEQWSDDHLFGQRATFRADRRPAALVVTNVKQRDEGLYRCRVDFRLAQTRNAHVNLTIVVPPRRPSISNKQGPVSTTSLTPMAEGQSLSLSCETIGGKPLPQLIWIRDGQIIDNTFSTTLDNVVRNDLWLPALNRQDLNSVLICEASNSNLTQPVSTSVIIDMYLRPLEVQLFGADQPLSAGKETTLTCIVRGSRPPPILTWFLDDHILAEMTAVATSIDGNETRAILQFTPNADDGGKKLNCRARNTNLSAVPNQEFMEDSRVLVVHYRPNVILSLGSNLQANSIKEGDDVYFDCHTSAFPAVTRIEWFHNDKKLWHNVSAAVIITDQSLVLQRVGRHSAGRYRCTAQNSEGETESDTFHLDIKYAPFCKPGQHRIYGIARHEEARITCDLDANPSTVVQFRWFFNSSAGIIELPNSAWTFEGSRSVARYLPSSDLDFGSLLCSASNVVGSQTIPCVYHVIPADKPDPVTNCSVSHQSSESLQITCNEGFSGGLPQTFLLEMAPTDDEMLRMNTTSSRPIFTIRGLRPDTHYVAYVSAVNAKGNSEPLVIRIVTLRPPETQRNTESADRPRSQPSSSAMAISPLVAIITGAVSALLLLAVLLVVALRLRCRRRRHRSETDQETRNSAVGRALSRDHLGPSTCSKTLLLGKGERSEILAHNTDNDDRNPDLIPHQDEDNLLQSAVAITGPTPTPIAAILADLPPHFCTRQLDAMPVNVTTLGRNKTRWREEAVDFTAQSLPHVSATLPRPPRPPWPTMAVPEMAVALCTSTAMTSKKESSV